MERLSWCKKRIKLTQPNKNLSEEYLRKAQRSLDATISLKNNHEWQITAAYYTMYFSIYSLLIRAGIKSEIHQCTIAIAELFALTKKEIELIEQAQKARIDLQYYVDRTHNQTNTMLQQAPHILLRCEELHNTLTQEDIRTIREQLR